jgi:hypothetical protein
VPIYASFGNGRASTGRVLLSLAVLGKALNLPVRTLLPHSIGLAYVLAARDELYSSFLQTG